MIPSGDTGLGTILANGRIGPYRILRRLGTGGSGLVFLAEAAESCPVPAGRQVAIKVLRTAGSPDREEHRRFERETRYLQSLHHPGIIRILDSGEHLGHPWLVMPLVKGRKLDDLVDRGRPLDERRAIDIAIQALEALHVAHLAGILHRDLKPGNLMLADDGRVKLLDFGFAADLWRESRLTRSGDVLGTPAYMSPEQAAGRRDAVTRRSDIYGMGACLYEMVTGRQPFEADNAIAVLRLVQEEPLTPPSRLNPLLSHDLETVILKAMAYDPRDRYRTAEDMAADLRKVAAGLPVQARRLGATTRLLRSLWRNRRAIAGASLAVFIATSTAALLVARLVRTRPVDEPQTAAEAAAWTEVRRWSGVPSLTFSPFAPLGGNVEVANLPPVQGPVRLSANLLLAPDLASGLACELAVSATDIGRGYRLRLETGLSGTEGQAPGSRLLLLRENRVVASHETPRVPRGLPMQLELERDDDALSGFLALPDGQVQRLRFLDLAPLVGPTANAVLIARPATGATVTGARLERRKRSEYVSALSTADALRQEGAFGRAAALYREFLQDHPASAQAPDARLRLALCLEALPNSTQEALDAFIETAREDRDDPRHVMVATVHAWACAVRLNRFAEAEQYFDAIRSSYDLPTLASSVPEETLKELQADYFARAGRLAEEEPERAARLFETCADIASFLGDHALACRALLASADQLLRCGDLPGARELAVRASQEPGVAPGQRARCLARLGELSRLAGDLQAATEAYQRGLKECTDEDREEAAWIRLWLGDLWCQLEEVDRAVRIWEEGAEAAEKTQPGHLMRLLTDLEYPMPEEGDPQRLNDIRFCNARVARLLGDQAGWKAWLQKVIETGPRWDWPTPLARHLAGED